MSASRPMSDDHEHDADHLVHGVELAAVVQQVAEAEAGEDGDVDFRRHQRAPGEGPALLHAADDERQRRGQDDARPGGSPPSPWCARRARRSAARCARRCRSRSATDQTVPMMTTNSIALSVWPNQSSASGTQHTLGSVCSPSASDADRVLEELRARGEQAERQADRRRRSRSRPAGAAASRRPPPASVPSLSGAPQILADAERRRQQHRRPAPARDHEPATARPARRRTASATSNAPHSATSAARCSPSSAAVISCGVLGELDAVDVARARQGDLRTPRGCGRDAARAGPRDRRGRPPRARCA